MMFLKDFPHLHKADTTIYDVLITHKLYEQQLEAEAQRRREGQRKRIYVAGK